MLELDQILRANEINFAILAALPAFFLSLGMLTLLRTWLKQVRILIIQAQTKFDSDTYMCRDSLRTISNAATVYLYSV